MIDLSDETTWPNDIQRVLEDSSENTNREKQTELRAHKDGSYIFNPPKTPILDKTKYEIERIIKGLEIRAFHCTRLQALETVRREGLSILDRKMAKERVLSALAEAGVSAPLMQQASDAFDDFEQSGQYRNREGMLWFVLTKEMTDDHGCEELLRYFGGEATRRALWHLREKLYPVLETIGTPAVVECRVPIADSASFQISNMTEEFIRYGHRKYLDKQNHPMHCEMFVPYSVSPDHVLDVWEKRLASASGPR